MAVSWNYIAFSLLISYVRKSDSLLKKEIFGKSQKLSQSKFSSIRNADFSSIWRNFFWRKFWSRPILNLLSHPEWNLPIVVTAVNEKNRELKKSQDGIGVHGSSGNVSFKTFIMSSNKSIWSSCSEPFNFPILEVRFCRLLFIRWKSSFAFACKFTVEAKQRELKMKNDYLLCGFESESTNYQIDNVD